MRVHWSATRVISAITILAAAGAATGVAVTAGSATAAPRAADKTAKVVHGGALVAVSGTSADDVWAVGNTASGTLTEHWNGARWTVVPSPSPGTGAGGYSELKGVAVVSPTDAWAVGTYASGPHEGDVTNFGLIEHWNGKRWSKVACPCGKGVGTAPALAGISAVSRSDIWAVGAGMSGALLLHWNGRQWAAAPLPGDAGDSLTAVSATSARNAWAVGNPGGARPALTAHWNGKKWSWVSAPHSGQFSDLRAVAATSPSSALAGGLGSGGGVDGLRWNGAKWSAVPGPKVTGRSNTFDAIAAVPGGGAWGVGFRTVGHGNTFNLIARWTGTRWVSVPSPDISLSDNDFLGGVWAASSRSAWAVGFSDNSQNRAEILHWNGKRWSLITP